MKLRIPYSEKNLSDFITEYIIWLIALPSVTNAFQTVEDFSLIPNFLLFWSLFFVMIGYPSYKKKYHRELRQGEANPSLYNAVFVFLLSVIVLFLGINVDRIFSGEELRHPRIYQIFMILIFSYMDNYGFYIHYLYQYAIKERETVTKE